MDYKYKDGYVKACPKCGRRYQNSCYHEGYVSPTEIMTAERAIALSEYTKSWMTKELELIQKDIDYYHTQQVMARC